MKLLILIYEADFDEEIMEFISSKNLGYTKWDRVLGKGKSSSPRLDDTIWPGFNITLAVMVEDDRGEDLVYTLRELSEKIGKKGFKVFEMPVVKII